MTAKYARLIDRIEKFAEDLTRISDLPESNVHQFNKEKLEVFATKLHWELRKVLGELGGELVLLQGRKFDHVALGAMRKIYGELSEVKKDLSVNLNEPYIGARRLVKDVLGNPGKAIIDNLEFIGRHHLKKTDVEVGGQSRLMSLEDLKQLAIWARDFMTTNHNLESDLIRSSRKLSTEFEAPTASKQQLSESMGNIPAFVAQPNDKTKV